MFFSIHKKRATRSYLLFAYPFDNLLLIYVCIVLGVCVCVSVYVCIHNCVDNKPLAQWREFIGAPALEKK